MTMDAGNHDARRGKASNHRYKFLVGCAKVA
jgi:hypothetical protein